MSNEKRCEIYKAIVLQKVAELKDSLDMLSREISPKHWRSTGTHFHALREMAKEIPLYTAMTDDERNSPIVQEGLILTGDYFKKKSNGTIYRVVHKMNSKVHYQEVSDDRTQFIGALKKQPIKDFLLLFEPTTLHL